MPNVSPYFGALVWQLDDRRKAKLETNKIMERLEQERSPPKPKPVRGVLRRTSAPRMSFSHIDVQLMDKSSNLEQNIRKLKEVWMEMAVLSRSKVYQEAAIRFFQETT